MRKNLLFQSSYGRKITISGKAVEKWKYVSISYNYFVLFSLVFFFQYQPLAVLVTCFAANSISNFASRGTLLVIKLPRSQCNVYFLDSIGDRPCDQRSHLKVFSRRASCSQPASSCNTKTTAAYFLLLQNCRQRQADTSQRYHLGSQLALIENTMLFMTFKSLTS